jgi:hypothetical protein
VTELPRKAVATLSELQARLEHLAGKTEPLNF